MQPSNKFERNLMQSYTLKKKNLTSNTKSLENYNRLKYSDLNCRISNWRYKMLQQEKIRMKSTDMWKTSISDFSNFQKEQNRYH